MVLLRQCKCDIQRWLSLDSASCRWIALVVAIQRYLSQSVAKYKTAIVCAGQRQLSQSSASCRNPALVVAIYRWLCDILARDGQRQLAIETIAQNGSITSATQRWPSLTSDGHRKLVASAGQRWPALTSVMYLKYYSMASAGQRWQALTIANDRKRISAILLVSQRWPAVASACQRWPALVID